MSNDKLVIAAPGISFIGILFIVLLILKCTGFMAATWPLWVVGGIILLPVAILLSVLLIGLIIFPFYLLGKAICGK